MWGEKLISLVFWGEEEEESEGRGGTEGEERGGLRRGVKRRGGDGREGKMEGREG